MVDVDAELLASLSQDPQQALPADRCKAMAARGEDLPPVVDVDVIPYREVFREPFIESRIGVFDASERLVGKNHPETEGVVRGISLPDLDLVLWVQELDQRRQVEPGRPAADDRDAQRGFRGVQLPSRSRNRCSLPVAVRGSSLANSIARGYL